MITFPERSHPEVAGFYLFVVEQFGRRGMVDDLSLTHDVDVVGEVEGKGEVLFDEQDGMAFVLEPLN